MFNSNRVRELLDQATDLPRDGRDGFLRRACTGDDDLYAHLCRLLDAVDRLDPLLTSLPTKSIPTVAGVEQFVAGTVLAERYRIVMRLGVGGMGEVYKADDLKLGQPVALKLLAETLASSPDAIARFHAETRIARQVSHPNVCRVHDIGDVDGLYFLIMEYIDGEDLGSLLRRVGYLPHQRALEVGRQICAGLAAVHESGIIHRDLKPGNVMIDGRGSARLMDFGISALAGLATAQAGTPAYMAPEQFFDQPATRRSDIYALGLVLYELFSGARAIPVTSAQEVAEYHRKGQEPPPPSARLPEIDGAVERTILSCLEVNPTQRPVSAIQVSARLPGRSLVQSALDAGVTPSPEMVAASGTSDGLRPIIAAALICVTALSLIFTASLRDRARLNTQDIVGLPPDVLVFTARRFLQQFGYVDRPVDSAFGFAYEPQLIQYIQARGGDFGQSLAGRPPGIVFWYRESQQPLTVTLRRRGVRAHSGNRPDGFIGSVTREDPPIAGRMTLVTLDRQGRLVGFEAMPSIMSQPPAHAFATALSAAQVDMARFSPVAPEWIPPFSFDERAAWTGAFEERANLPVRIEVASYRGALVSMVINGEWSRNPFSRNAPIWLEIAMLCLIGGGYVLAWRNLRSGRSDTRGATRVAFAGFTIKMADFFLLVHHVGGADEFWLFWRGVMEALFVATNFGAFYLAVEPAVRRRRPHVLIGWARVIDGHVSDPLVARQALIGVALGVVSSMLAGAIALTTPTLSMQASLDAAASVSGASGVLVGQFGSAVATGLGMCCLLVVLGDLLRSERAAAAIGIVLFAALHASELGPVSLASLAGGFCLGAMLVVATLRVGLVAGVMYAFAAGVVATIPLTLQRSVWFFGVSNLAMLTIVVIAASCAYVTTRSARPTTS